MTLSPDDLYRTKSGAIKTGFRGEQLTVTRSGVTDAAPVHAVAAALSTDLANATNNDLTFTAKAAGALGNTIKIAYVISGSGSTATVSVSNNDITVTAGSACTAATVKTAIEAHTQANALVTVANKAANDGTGAISALAATELAGGSNATEAGAGDTRVDSGYLYVAYADVDASSTSGWKRIALSALA